MADPFSLSPDDAMMAPNSDLERTERLKAALGKTWPAQLIKAALGAAALPGDVYSGRTPMAAPGVRREDVTDVPDAAQPNDAVIGRAADLAGLAAGVSTPFAEPGAVGIFGGRLAKTANQAKLAEAEGMAAKGVYPDEIHAATGWFQGADGKWRFEIPDNTSAIRNAGAGRMGEAFEHDPLYAAYPDLKDTKMLWGAPPGHGSYNPGVPELGYPETIQLSQFKGSGFDGGQRSLALHELQHAVQEREGFAKGANAGAFQQQDEAKLARDALSFRRELDQMPKSMDPHARENAVVQKYQEMGAMDRLPSREARDLAHDRHNNPDAQLGELVKAYGLDQRTTTLTGREIYKRHAGEVEARNVQHRADWDAQKRADVPPVYSQDVPNKDQIVRFGENSPFSMAPQMSMPIKPPRRLWRGIVEGQQESGAQGLGTAHLGRGIYSSKDKDFAKMYATNGKLVDVPISEGWPTNPLVLRGSGGAESLLIDYIFKNTKYKNIREFNKDYPDRADWLRKHGFDGVVAGDEVVKFPSKS